MCGRAQQIVVGVDETLESRLALRWAVEAAAGRGAVVRVIRAYLNEAGQWPAPVDSYQAELDAAVAFANDRLGAGRASGRLVNGSAARAILGGAVDADLIVLGSRDRSEVEGAFLGSVATAVTAGASCPVVVVRGNNWAGPILVGTDGSADCEEAVAFAFEEADRAGLPLTVAYGWQPLHHHDAESAVAEKRVLLEHWLSGTIQPYRQKYPEVSVQVRVVMGRPEAALAELTPGSSLIVVGSRGCGESAGLVGCVGQDLLDHASCSVAVVHSRGVR